MSVSHLILLKTLTKQKLFALAQQCHITLDLLTLLTLDIKGACHTKHVVCNVVVIFVNTK